MMTDNQIKTFFEKEEKKCRKDIESLEVLQEALPKLQGKVINKKIINQIASIIGVRDYLVKVDHSWYGCYCLSISLYDEENSCATHQLIFCTEVDFMPINAKQPRFNAQKVIDAIPLRIAEIEKKFGEIEYAKRNWYNEMIQLQSLISSAKNAVDSMNRYVRIMIANNANISSNIRGAFGIYD